MHKFTKDQLVEVKSGRLYRILRLRFDNHRKLNGELGYNAIMQRDGKDFGPIRLLRESTFKTIV